MRTLPRWVIVALVLALSVVIVSPVSAARLPVNNAVNTSLAPVAWSPQQPHGGQPQYGCYTYYQVQWGNTLYGIAAYYHTSIGALMAANPSIWNPNVIYACQVLCIPYPTYAAPYPTYSTYPTQPAYPPYSQYPAPNPYSMYSQNPAPVQY